MNAKKIFIAIGAAVGLFRIWILLRQKGFREFPLYFLGFAIGLLLVAVSIERFQAGDTRGTMGKGSVAFWYQDLGIGITFILVTISASWACLSRDARVEEPPQKQVFSPEEWKQFDTELSANAPPKAPKLPKTHGLDEFSQTTRVLHSFDTELIHQISEEFDKSRIAFNRVPVEEEAGLEAWELSVKDADQAAAVRLIDEIEKAYRVETSSTRCNRCGSGMLPKEYETEIEEPVGIRVHVCSNCGAELLQ